MHATDIDVGAHRHPAHDVLDLIFTRWSPRAMSGEAVTREELARLFEAARWAPSSYNAQPWRIVYARRDSEDWPRFLALLVEGNRQWAADAGALLVFLSRRRFEANDKPSITHSFDTGAAWQNLALQAHAMGLVVHGMEGFDYDGARRSLQVPDDYEVLAMAAVGRPGEVADLPGPLQEREQPSDRKPVEEFVHEGVFDREA